MGRHTPTVKKSYNPKRDQVTYRISKQGVNNQFLLFGREEIIELQKLLAEALGGHYERTG